MSKEYCYSIDGVEVSDVYNSLAGARRAAIRALKGTGKAIYWIGEYHVNNVEDYLDAKSILFSIVENMDEDDHYPPDDALNSITDEEYDMLSKKMAGVINAFFRKSHKGWLGECILNIEEYSVEKEEPLLPSLTSISDQLANRGKRKG